MGEVQKGYEVTAKGLLASLAWHLSWRLEIFLGDVVVLPT